MRTWQRSCAALRRAVQTTVILCLTTPVDLPRQHAFHDGAGYGINRVNGDVDAYNTVAREVAAEHGVLVHDLHRVVLEGPGGAAAMLGEDGVHFSDLGTRSPRLQ